MKFLSRSEKDTYAFAKRVADRLKGGEVILLSGDLGAGKTTFTKGLALALGVKETVTSPTFTYVKEYEGRLPLFHFDMYRLKDSDELFEIGWEDYLERGGVCAVEWSENVKEAFLPGTIYVDIAKTGETERVITIDMPAGRDGVNN